jgi:hypothetical protein
MVAFRTQEFLPVQRSVDIESDELYAAPIQPAKKSKYCSVWIG